MRRRVGGLLVAVGLALVLFSGPATALTHDQTTNGTAVAIETQTEQDLLNDQAGFAAAAGEPLRTRAFILWADGTQYFVFTNATPRTGRVSVTGTRLSPTELGGEAGVIFADSVAVNTTGTPVEATEVRSNPGAYEHELVRITGPYRSVAYTVDPGGGVVSQRIAGAIGPTPTAGAFATPPAAQARWVLRNLSQADGATGRQARATFRAGAGSESLLMVGPGPAWTMNGTATVDAVVRVIEGQPFLYPAAVTPRARTTLDSPAAIGPENAGEVVTVETAAVGARVSAQETLLSIASCGEGAVYVGQACVPAVTDTVLESGVLFEGVPEDGSDVVPFIGLSNRIQQQPTADTRGRYRVTGRVVAIEQLDPSLSDRYGLLVYDAERTGDIDNVGVAREAAAQLRGRLVRQLNGTVEPPGDDDGDGSDGDGSGDGDGDGTGNGDGSDGDDGDGDGTGPNPSAPGALVDVVMNTSEIDVFVNETRAINLTVTNNGPTRVNTANLNLSVESGTIEAAEFVIPPGESSWIPAQVQVDQPGRHAVRHAGDRIGTINATQFFCVEEGNDAFFINGSVAPSTVAPGETVTTTLTVENIFLCDVTRSVNVSIDGRELASQTVTVPEGAAKTVTVTFTAPAPDALGDAPYVIESNGFRIQRLTYASDTGPSNNDDDGGPGDTATDLPGFGVPAVVIALVVVIGLLRRRGGR